MTSPLRRSACSVDVGEENTSPRSDNEVVLPGYIPPSDSELEASTIIQNDQESANSTAISTAISAIISNAISTNISNTISTNISSNISNTMSNTTSTTISASFDSSLTPKPSSSTNDLISIEIESSNALRSFSAQSGLLMASQTTNLGKLNPTIDISVSLISVGSCVCRICHTNNTREGLISPCNCKGSLAYVHRSCLERWLTQASLGHCEVCLYPYHVVMSRRYGCMEALCMWLTLPRNRGLLQSDFLICTLFTIVTFGLVTVFLVGARLFVIGGLKLGISRIWTHGAISFSLAVLIIAYFVNLYLIIRGQVSPWWAWWRSNVTVRLILDEDRITERVIASNNVLENA